nr:hypothetical protein [uncultured Draconibacterium sp.]
MKLLPHYFKWIGLVVFFGGLTLSLIGSIGSEDFIEGMEMARGEPIEVAMEPLFSASLVHVFDVALIVGLLVYILAKNKREDEMMQKIRNESAFIALILSLAIILIIYVFKPEYRIYPSDLLSLQMIAYLIIRVTMRKFILGGDYEEQTVLENKIEQS